MLETTALDEKKGPAGRKHRLIIVSIAICLILFLGWADEFGLDEVAIGEGRVIPSSQTQLVQSVRGGRVKEILASEGEMVEAGALLAVLDTTQLEAEIAEIEADLENERGQQEVLTSLLRGDEALVFQSEQLLPPQLAQEKIALFEEMRLTQQQALADIEAEQVLLRAEEEIFARASLSGGGTEIERLRLQQKIAGTQTRLNSQRQTFARNLRLDLDEVNRAVEQMRIRLAALKDTRVASELRSPRAGIVQEILVSTAGGGVLPPNGTAMKIVPLEDRLLIEARFSPRDIAFIAPGQTAQIKVSAYDHSIFGGLEAQVLRVSPDSFQDELNQGTFYFAVTLESARTYFTSLDGQNLSITPGMVATAEIQTGHRTIMSYLLKPLSKASLALRER